MYPYPITPGDEDICMRTIWMEARGEPYEGKVAVAHVILNRALSGRGRWCTPAKVCLDHMQFSGWRPQDPNLIVALQLSPSDLRAQDCLRAWREVVLRPDPDPTLGSLHYLNPAIASPPWAKGKVPAYIVGAHHFFNNID